MIDRFFDTYAYVAAALLPMIFIAWSATASRASRFHSLWLSETRTANDLRAASNILDSEKESFRRLLSNSEAKNRELADTLRQTQNKLDERGQALADYKETVRLHCKFVTAVQSALAELQAETAADNDVPSVS